MNRSSPKCKQLKTESQNVNIEYYFLFMKSINSINKQETELILMTLWFPTQYQGKSSHQRKKYREMKD